MFAERSGGTRRCRAGPAGLGAGRAVAVLRIGAGPFCVPIEDISHFVGHSTTVVTEKVYRKELRPVLTRGARAMNRLFEGQAR